MKRPLRTQEQGWNKVDLTSLNLTGRVRAKYHIGFVLWHPKVRIEPDSPEQCPQKYSSICILDYRPGLRALKGISVHLTGCQFTWAWILTIFTEFRNNQAWDIHWPCRLEHFLLLLDKRPAQCSGTEQTWTLLSRDSWAWFWTNKNEACPMWIYPLGIDYWGSNSFSRDPVSTLPGQEKQHRGTESVLVHRQL